MALPHLNGWRRLWLAVAGFTLFLAILLAFSNATKRGATDNKLVAAFENPNCDYIRTLPKGFELEDEPEYGTDCYSLYVENRYASTPMRSAVEYQAKVASEYTEGLLTWLGVSLAIWVVGITLLYGAGATAAWVRRGFQGGSTGSP